MAENLRALKILIEKLNTWVKKLNPSDDLCKSEDYMETIENVIMDIEEKIEDLDYELEELDYSIQKQFFDKISDYKNDFEIIKTIYNKKKAQVIAEHKQEILMRKEQHKDSNDNDLKSANNNSKNINVEAKKQGE